LAEVSISSGAGVEPNIRISSSPKFLSNIMILARVRTSIGIPVMIRDGVRILVGVRVNIKIPVRIRASIRILVRVRTSDILVRVRTGIGVPVRIRASTKILVKIRNMVRILSTVRILSRIRALPDVRISHGIDSCATPILDAPPPTGVMRRILQTFAHQRSQMVC